ncbi:MAG: hypothetical protein COA78_09175 [Blastopirellula sp.]|nr:MAG: hypothetical protein COA78_09175 [Blastopirellula sp.]
MKNGTSATTIKRQSELSRFWIRWMNQVDQIAQNTDRAKRLKQKKYHHLHSSLMKVIDECLTDSMSEEQHETLGQMRRLCKPWVSLSAFYQAEKHLVTDLLHTGQHLHFELTGHHTVQRKTVFKLLKRAFIIGLCLVPVSLWGINQFVSEDLTINIRGFLYRKFYFMQEIGPYQILPIVVVGVVLFGMWMLRSTKQY